MERSILAKRPANYSLQPGHSASCTVLGILSCVDSPAGELPNTLPSKLGQGEFPLRFCVMLVVLSPTCALLRDSPLVSVLPVQIFVYNFLRAPTIGLNSA
jgi:hypothetical protein